MDTDTRNMLYFITGGVRSGKSSYAQNLALSLSPNPVYLATSRIWDEAFNARVKRHIAERNEQWTTVEEEKFLSKVNLSNKVAVIDCVTLWLTNFFVDSNSRVQESLDQARAEFDNLLLQEKCTLIIVSNEIGMGVHAESEVGRKFTDLQGWMNQYIAGKANHVTVMISGIPLKIK